MSRRERDQLCTRVRYADVHVDDIALQPCFDGQCDGPWHEYRVLHAWRVMGRICLTTFADTRAFTTYRGDPEEELWVLPRTARYCRPAVAAVGAPT